MIRHRDSRVVLKGGRPHLRLEHLVIGERGVHPVVAHVAPGQAHDHDALLAKWEAVVVAHDAADGDYRAFEGKTFSRCHRSVTVHDFKIQVHGPETFTLVLTATGAWEGHDVYEKREWNASAIGKLPSAAEAIGQFAASIAADCHSTHHFAGVLSRVRHQE